MCVKSLCVFVHVCNFVCVCITYTLRISEMAYVRECVCVCVCMRKAYINTKTVCVCVCTLYVIYSLSRDTLTQQTLNISDYAKI